MSCNSSEMGVIKTIQDRQVVFYVRGGQPVGFALEGQAAPE